MDVKKEEHCREAVIRDELLRYERFDMAFSFLCICNMYSPSTTGG